MKKALLILPFVFALAACDVTPTSTRIEREAQERLALQATQSVGMPAITNFAEKRMMKDILELRDQNVATYTYTQDMNGKYHLVCNSVGYGLPYATQFTNPQRIAGDGAGHYGTLPQADPNGLFSPPSADGTWVMCVNPQTKKLSPAYVEPRITVTTFPMGQ
jgi:hypothetical protein